MKDEVVEETVSRRSTRAASACRTSHINPCNRQKSTMCIPEDHLYWIQDGHRLQYIMLRRQGADHVQYYYYYYYYYIKYYIITVQLYAVLL